MKEYLIDFSKVQLNENESLYYYSNDIFEIKKMNRDISKYIEIEKKYILLFIELFNINNKKVEIKFENFSFYEIEYLFEEEKEEFKRFFKNLSFEEIFFRKKFEIVNINYLKMLVKISYRNIWETKNLIFYFKNLNIEIHSIGDYLYILKKNKKLGKKIIEIFKQKGLYIKEL